jgi:hypothetical protein
MKRAVYSGVLLILLVFSGCKKKEIKTIEENMVQGTWKISYCLLDGEDKSTEFKSTVFTFLSNGNVSVADQTTVVGTWNVAKENDANSDGIFTDRHVEVSLNFPVPYTWLTNDWEVDSQSKNTLLLKNENSNSGQIDHLTFEKW